METQVLGNKKGFTSIDVNPYKNNMVPKRGLEPRRPKALPPQTDRAKIYNLLNHNQL